MKREKGGGGIHVIGEKKVLVAKVKNTVTLQPRQGKWIPIVCKLSYKNNIKRRKKMWVLFIMKGYED